MISFTKKILLLLGIVFLIGLIWLYFILNTKWLLEKSAPAFVNLHLEKVILSEGEVELQQFRFPASLRLKKVRFILGYKENIYLIKMEDFSFSWNYWSKLRVKINGLRIYSGPISLEDVALDLTVRFGFRRIKDIRGKLTAGRFDFKGFSVTDITAKVRRTKNKIELNRLEGKFFSGEVTGDISVEYVPAFVYTSRLDFEQVCLKEMLQQASLSSSKLRAQVDGHIDLKGDDDHIRFIQVALCTPQGGRLKASLLEPLLSYIPQSSQRENLEMLMEIDGDVFFEIADVRVKSTQEEKLYTHITLVSDEINLDTDVEIDVNIEGGLKNLFRYLEKISQ